MDVSDGWMMDYMHHGQVQKKANIISGKTKFWFNLQINMNLTA